MYNPLIGNSKRGVGVEGGGRVKSLRVRQSLSSKPVSSVLSSCSIPRDSKLTNPTLIIYFILFPVITTILLWIPLCIFGPEIHNGIISILGKRMKWIIPVWIILTLTVSCKVVAAIILLIQHSQQAVIEPPYSHRCHTGTRYEVGFSLGVSSQRLKMRVRCCSVTSCTLIYILRQ